MNRYEEMENADLDIEDGYTEVGLHDFGIESPAAELDLTAALNALPRPEGITINRFYVTRNVAQNAPEHVRHETRVYLTWTDRETMGRPVSERFWGMGPTSNEADAIVLAWVIRWMHL